MSGPHLAELAAKALREGLRGSSPPASPSARADAIAAVERAIEARNRRKRMVRWMGGLAAAAAVIGLVVGGVQLAHRRARSAGTTAATAPAAAAGAQARVEVVAHPSGVGATLVTAGASAPLVEGRALASGSRVVTPPSARVLLAFATGASVVLGQDGDLTITDGATSPALRLDSGGVELRVGPGDTAPVVVRTEDAEIEVRAGDVHVSKTDGDSTCAGGTTTRVTVGDGAAVVRHAGREAVVGSHSRWPLGCAAAAAPSSATAQAESSSGISRAAPAPAATSTLADQNNLFAEAVAAKRRGDPGAALAAFDRFLAKYPASPLAESATVERMRILRTSDPSRAAVAARQYLAAYPNGFAHAEAEAIAAAGKP